MKIKYTDRQPVHVKMIDGTIKTLYKDMIVDGVLELPAQGAEYCVIFPEPKVKVGEATKKIFRKVKE